MAPFSKPETVLKQAEGLVSVGQTHAALQSLTEMFSSKRFRSTPLTSLEPIMHRFIELCVDMRKGRTAKEGLMQYKNIAQNTSVQSIENVINRFLQLADAKVKEAQEKAAVQQSAVDVDDLEASETPESILLGAVSGDQSKDRTDRALVTPWLKFLWESYRTSLETLKNNARLETIYQQIAQQAFKFCLKHERKVEFRRLCETLRLHLANVAKYSHQQHSINLSDPDTLQHHLDTRFAQLNTSVELELWQEAFRSVEDVHNLLTMAKKAPRPAMMANYYEKLTKIFLMSGNALFHAAAWGKYYSIVTSIGGKSEEELSRLAGQVLVSTLAVPVGIPKDDHHPHNNNSNHNDADLLKGKNARLTALLGLNRMPTRGALLQDALARDVLKLAPDSVKGLYAVLEVQFEPLTLCESVSKILQVLAQDANYASYLPLLQRALLSRLLNQLSQVYSTIKIERILELVKPLREKGLEGAYDDEQVEAYVMGCARRGELNIRVDHKDGSITFVDEAFTHSEEPPAPVASTSKSGLQDQQHVQPSVAELVRTRLSNVAVSLHVSLQRIEGASTTPSKAPLSPEEQQAKFKALVTSVEAERKALQIRRALVARRRELLSELSVRKEKEESSRRAEITRKEKEAEAIRQRDEMKRKEMERAKKEIENIRIDEAKKYAQTLVDKGILKPTEIDKLENYDTEGLITIQVAQLEKEKRELNEKLRIIAKRIDHIERAYRKEERPLLAQDYAEQQKSDREKFLVTQAAHKEASYQAHLENIETKKRLARMIGDYKVRKEVLMEKRGVEYEKRVANAKRKMEDEKEKRRRVITKQREEERVKREREEEERRRSEEDAERIERERQEEEERVRQEEEDRLRKEEEEKAAVEEAAAAARAAREKERQEALELTRLRDKRAEEAEARRKEEKEKAAAAARRPLVGVSRDTTRDGGQDVWRRTTPVNSVPGTPSRSSAAAASGPPERSESPTPAGGAPARYRPPAFGGGAAAGGGAPVTGWRARAAAAAAGGAGSGSGSGANTPVRSASPAPPPREEVKKDEEGFTPVTKPSQEDYEKEENSLPFQRNSGFSLLFMWLVDLHWRSNCHSSLVVQVKWREAGASGTITCSMRGNSQLGTRFHDTSPAERPLKSYVSQQPPIHETPRKHPRVEVNQDQQIFMREETGHHMNDETLECEVEVFLASYLPQHQFSEETYKAISAAGVARARDHFKENFPFHVEAEISSSLQEIVGSLVKAREDLGEGRNLQYSSSPNQTVISCIIGGNLKIDASLNSANGSEALHTTNIVVAMGSKLSRNFDTVRKNRQQLVSAIVHILNDDVRRMFMFGITVEGPRMTLWYFSRSHSVKAQSFNFVEQPDILVEVLISLIFADDKDLGFDPNIALTSDAKRQYIYTVDGEAGPRCFLTTHSIFENRALTVAGRMTRVFRVVELDGQTDSPKEGAKPMVLKDVWLDEGSQTEMEIQEELFADIEEFGNNPNWRKDPCLAAFEAEDAETMEAFGELLQEQRYQDLFLVIRDGSTGECSKPLAPSAWHPKSKIFYPAVDPPLANEPFPSTQRLTEPQSSATRNLQIRPADEATEVPYRTHASKRRSFLVFDDECTRLYCLPNVGDVFTVLRDCITALRLMFCAGWVHRDISCNNIMAVRDSETQQWKLKLADLEYGKKFGLQTGTSDPKTGTPFFMPCEILRRRYFGDDDDVTEEDALARLTMDPNDDETSETPEFPLLHNFLHDLEASFWTGLWIITSRVNHEPSRLYALGIFKNTSTLTLPESRLKAFRKPIKDALNGCLPEKLKKLAPTFEAIRKMLHTCAKVMGKKRTWWESPGYKIYSNLHANFALAFASLADPQAPWASVELQPPTSSSPRPMDAIVDGDPNKTHVAPVSGEEEKAGGEEREREENKNKDKNKKKERLPRRVKPRHPDDETYTVRPASGRKRSHREGEQADDDDSEGRSSNSKRVKSNNGGRVSASGPSGASTSAGGSSGYRLRSKGRN